MFITPPAKVFCFFRYLLNVPRTVSGIIIWIILNRFSIKSASWAYCEWNISVGKKSTGQCDSPVSSGGVLSLVDLQCIWWLLTLSSYLHCPVICSSLNTVSQLLMMANPWCSPCKSIHKSQQILDAWDPLIHQRWARRGSLPLKKTASLGAGAFYIVCSWCCNSVSKIALIFLKSERNE